MKIYLNDMWCDTKIDWGYKSDKEFIDSIYYQLRVAKAALKEITKYDYPKEKMFSVAEQAISHMKDIDENNRKK